MDNKRMKMFIWIFLIIALLAVLGFYVFKYLQQRNQNSNFLEYTPQEEISDNQLRNTIVKLYFKDASSNSLKTESRNIDIKELVSNPYLTLMNLLIQGPNSDSFQKTIPDGTIVNNASLDGDILILDLSENFINNHAEGFELENATVYSIVYTLTELTEVNSVKILIDGKENCSFKDNSINFNNAFSRK